MANRNYKKGYKVERECIFELTLAGYTCVRAAGSHGVIDVVAFNDNGGKLIQVKSSNKPCAKSSFSGDIMFIKQLLCPNNFTKELWVRIKGIKDFQKYEVE